LMVFVYDVARVGMINDPSIQPNPNGHRYTWCVKDIE